ncbi:MAG: hypothetical protein M3033_15185 [Acidobacteriota bacterium]|nr:hypothetical protein [Acidobacteriota bacterium]
MAVEFLGRRLLGVIFMKHGKSKRNAGNYCFGCSVKFSKYRLTCPFCRKVIIGNLPILIISLLGIVGVLFTVSILAMN